VTEFAVGLESLLTAGTAVPKAAVHEDGEATLAENKLMIAEDRLMPATAGYTAIAQQLRKNKLGPFVALTLDRRY